MNKNFLKDSYILGLQTVEYPSSIALVKNDGSLIKQLVIKGRKNTIEYLGKLTTTILKMARLNVGDISLVAVCIGPGSYTGIRGGLGFAKGFCQYSKIPIIGVTVFDVMDYIGNKEGIIKAGDSVVFTVDARGERVYYKQDELDDINVGPISEVVQQFPKRTKYVGSGALENKDAIQSFVGKRSIIFDKILNATSAKEVAQTGIEQFDPNSYRYDTIYELQPLYVLDPTITKPKKK